MYKVFAEDLKLNSYRSFLILFFYRITNWCYYKEKYLLVKLLNIVFFFIRVLLSIHSQISYKAIIGRRIRLPHTGFGVVISAKAYIGDNITIYHLVTIGINEFKCKKNSDVCVEIGDNCYISTGAKIISSKVGANSIIGPNAVIYKDISENSRVFTMMICK